MSSSSWRAKSGGNPSVSGPDRVRISVRPYWMADESRIWSHTYERDLAGVFRLQTDIAERVVEEAGVALRQEVRALWVVPPNENTDAHDLWMEGRFVAADSWIEESVLQALSLVHRAVELDPAFWWAWADISWAKFFLGRDGASPELCLEAEEALEQAAALAGEDLTIHYFRAWYLYRCPNDYDRALEELERIRSVMPGQYYRLRSAIYGRQGNREARFEAMRHAFDLDPRSGGRAHELSVIYGVAREFRESLEWAERAIELNPDYSRGYLDKGFLVLALTGDADAARALGRAGRGCSIPATPSPTMSPSTSTSGPGTLLQCSAGSKGWLLRIGRKGSPRPVTFPPCGGACRTSSDDPRRPAGPWTRPGFCSSGRWRTVPRTPV